MNTATVEIFAKVGAPFANLKSLSKEAAIELVRIFDRHANPDIVDIWYDEKRRAVIGTVIIPDAAFATVQGITEEEWRREFLDKEDDGYRTIPPTRNPKRRRERFTDLKSE